MSEQGQRTEAEALLNALTERVIGCAFRVGTELGGGFLEKVYENALAHELTKAGIKFEQQRRLVVRYDGIVVGEYISDIVVEDILLVEVKAVRAIDPAHAAQCLNSMTATRIAACLLLNSGPRVTVKRFINSNQLNQAVSSHLRSSAPSAATSSSQIPMTWAEQAEYGDS